MPTIGALARVDRNDHENVRQALSRLKGVETFDLDDPELVGLMIEGKDLDSANRVLAIGVAAVRGVQYAWPVALDLDDETIKRGRAVTVPDG